MINNNVIKVIRENYTGYKDNEGVTFYEWLKYNGENDPEGIFSNLFKGWNGIYDNLTEEQKAEFDNWMNCLEKESEYSKIISKIEGCYIDVFEFEPINNKEAVLVTFNFDGEVDGTTSAVIYNDGTVFTLQDWQSGEYPLEPYSIKDYDWMELSTKKEALIFNGLPRLLF